MKKCKHCGATKPINEFYAGYRTQDGHGGKCKKCISAINADRYKLNPDRHKETAKRWVKANPEKVKARQKRRDLKRLSSPKGIISNRMRVAVWEALRGNKNSHGWESLVGYTSDRLKRHIESLFIDGMSWDNRNLWHIDHIIPIAAFNFTSSQDIDFKKCWSLNNLRPLWKEENIYKNDTLLSPFQPSFAISGG